MALCLSQHRRRPQRPARSQRRRSLPQPPPRPSSPPQRLCLHLCCRWRWPRRGPSDCPLRGARSAGTYGWGPVHLTYRSTVTRTCSAVPTCPFPITPCHWPVPTYPLALGRSHLPCEASGTAGGRARSSTVTRTRMRWPTPCCGCADQRTRGLCCASATCRRGTPRLPTGPRANDTRAAVGRMRTPHAAFDKHSAARVARSGGRVGPLRSAGVGRCAR